MKKLKRPKILAILMITFIICTIPMTVFAATDMRADMNSDGKVNSADAIYLLRHTIMSDKYPIANAGDMNGDGRINSADAIYLLRHTIMPDKYPIKSECVHNEVIDLGINATCTKIGLTEGKHCSICGTVFQKQEIIPKLDPIMNNGECVNCGYEFIDYSDLDLYDSTYGFEYLGTLPKGKSLQEFYKRLDNVAKTFHSNTTMDASISTLNGKGQLSEVYYKDIGLSYEDAVMTLSIFKKDHPIYYWLANRWIYNSTSGWLRLNVDPAYIKGEDRAYYNELIYDGIKSYTSIAQGETSPYLITLAYHDAILSSVEYAYEQDGKTPVSAIWAHSIMGVFDKKGVVCEGYAKTLQLLLNFSGIKNVLVDGISNSLHAWNLICLDDGQWYWCDATWNDSDGYRGDIKYNYFCVNDTQFINWSDELLGWNSPILGSKSFMDSHTPFDPSANDAWRKQYVLPERAPCIFDNDSVLELREIFTIGDYTYALTGYNKVQLISVKNRNALIIPEYVVYHDTVYQVTSIGSILDNGFFTANGSISTNAMTKIIMPSSIEYIWDYALSMDNTTIYYGDTAENWEKLHKNNHVFNDAKIYYYSETMPEENDKFWHYYKGEITIWKYHQHIEIIDPAIMPSCTEDGLTEGKHCSICDEIIVKQEIVPAIGHDFVNGFCYVCGEKYVTPYEYFIFTLLDDGTYSIRAKDRDNIPENVIIPASYNDKAVTSIGSFAFTDCSSLTSITIPDSVTSIGMVAFHSCSSLASINIPDSVTNIGRNSFQDCTSLKRATIGNGMTSLDVAMFYGCTNLQSVILGNNVTSIGASAFYNCSSLTSIDIPNGVTSIGASAFYNCSSLTSIDIPNGVTSIGQSAFRGCSSLTSIDIPDGVTSIDQLMFRGCSNLVNITISNSVKNIGQSAFLGCSSLTSINIPESVTSIGEMAFHSCSSLSNINIPNGVTSIGNGAFFNCTSLQSITIPGNIMTISKNLFRNCRNLTNVTIGEGVLTIEEQAFGDCNKLKQLVLPKSIESINKNVFYGCNTLDTVFYTGIPVDWNTMTIGENNTSLTKVNIYFYSQYHPTNNCTAYWHYENDTPTIWGHNEVISTGVPATCTESGLTDGTHCSYCSTVIVPQNIIPATGHNKMDMPMVVPTCTTDGSIGGVYCSICNKIFEEPYVRPAYGHRIVSEGASDPTYTNGGMTAKEYCSRCGLVFKEQENIPVKVGDFSLFIDDPYHYADQNLMICDKNKTYEILIYDKNYDQCISISETPNLSLEISATSATITESGLLSFTAGCSDYLYLKCGDEIIDSVEIYSPNDFSRVNADFMKNQSEMFIDGFCPNNQLKIFNYQSKYDYSRAKINVSFDVYNVSPVIYGVASCYSDGRIYDLQYIDGYWINYSISEIITETLFIGLPDLLTGKYWAGESAFQSQKTSINMDVPAGGYIQLVSFKDNENVRMANIAQYIVCVYQTTEDAMELLDNSSEVLFKNFDIYKCVDILSKLPEPQKIAIETAFNTVHWKDACTAFFQLLASGEIDHTIIKQMFTYGLKDTFVDIPLSLAESAENALLKKYCPIAYTVVNGIDAIGDCAQLAIFGKQIQAINNTDSFLYESGFQFWYPNYGEW